jgi:hypothetical protein
MKPIYAEDVPYYQTGKSAAETWIERAKKEIRSVGGKITSEMFGVDETGRAAFMLAFQIGEEHFRLLWPVLPTRKGDPKSAKAAKVQAATALYHDVKAKVVTAKFMGVRTAFFAYLMLPNGQTASQAAGTDILGYVPPMMLKSGQ